MSADISSILLHLNSSINPVSNAIQALSALLGFMFIWQAIKKLRNIADSRARYTGSGRMFIPAAYFMGGCALFFLPTMVDIAGNTFFGTNSPIAYQSWVAELVQQYGNAAFIVPRMVQLAGLIWFVRGVTLLVHSSQPGFQHGTKGLAFLIAGIVAVNVDYAYQGMSAILNYFVKHGLAHIRVVG